MTRFCALILLFLNGTGLIADEPSAEQVKFVRTKVLPLLESRCFQCHRDEQKIRGGLYLGNRKGMLKGGESGPAVVPHKPDESLLIEAIRYESFEMPPRSQMPQPEIDILVKWIRDGAHWPHDLDRAVETSEEPFPIQERMDAHWVWQSIANPPAPKVQDASWPRDSIDAFILQRLEESGLSPAADADRNTLIRRLYFDIIGLPPTPQQVADFVSNPGTDDEAIETVVDELLQSPHFGERWGRHWLDLMRYAETLGHEFDYPLHHAHRYRDYVIRAFNADVPYDQLLTEHLAGDLQKNPRRHPTELFNESVIGTGFWFLCEDKHSPVDVKGEEAAKVDNQLDVFSRTFLGMTVACARCHDHKFDAISTSDYYALSGYLQSSRRTTAWLDPGRQVEKRIKDIDGHRSKATRLLTEKPLSSNTLTKYTLAALETIHGVPRNPPPKALAPVVFEDFEDSNYEGWKVDGEAFGDRPHPGAFSRQQAVSGFTGKQLVNSFQDNDNLTGKMTSREFEIQHSAIEFLIGGGNFSGRVCVNLVINGKVVRTQTGKNAELLVPASWDVSDLVGSSAHLEIVDEQKGGWGHINLDQIVFTNQPSASPWSRDVKTVATERQCDAGLLRRWTKAISDPKHLSATSPLSIPAQLAQRPGQPVRFPATSDDNPQKHSTVEYASLRNGLPDDWFAHGHAFEGMKPGQPNGLEWRGDHLAWNSGQGVCSATHSRELRGTLFTPTFELKHPEILVRVAGQGTRMRLIIDGYQMFEFNGLLFGGAKQNIDTNGEFRWLRFGGDMHRYQGHRMHIEFLDEGNGWFCVQEIRFANKRGESPPEDEVNPVNLSLTQAAAQDRSDKQIVNTWAAAVEKNANQLSALLVNHGFAQEALAEWKATADHWTAAATGIPTPIPVIAVTDGTAENEHVFIRGSHKNLGPEVQRSILTALQKPGINPVDNNGGSGRLQLAEQLLADSNPLVARVAVNRIWHHLFGRGIVESTDNFGVLGKRPTHPLLLDHLATRFRDNGWSVKQMIRAIVLSRAWRMSSQRSSAADEKDPTNQLWHRANVKRLQGEAVRDAILAVSGRLDRTQFGPSVPLRLTNFMQGRGRPRTNGPVDGNGRRSIYLAVNRNFLSPFMLAFDVPAPVTARGKRTVSNVPAQALIMLNNEFVRQQSGVWAKKLLAEQHGDAPATLAAAWQQLYSYPAARSDLAPLLAFAGDSELDEQLLTELCHVMLNSKEFLFLH